jgi:hypothetical protein
MGHQPEDQRRNVAYLDELQGNVNGLRELQYASVGEAISAGTRAIRAYSVRDRRNVDNTKVSENRGTLVRRNILEQGV